MVDLGSPVVGVRTTWRRRLGVLTIAWYTLRAGRVRLLAMVHLPLPHP